MEYSNGFLSPNIDKAKCLNCGKCLNHCIAHNSSGKLDRSEKNFWYGAIEDENLIRSASGGAAYGFGRYIISQMNGVVYGVAYGEDWLPEYIRVDNVKDLIKIQGTKYAQARKNGIYKNIKVDLDKGLEVLFIGTPCEVAAVRRYLKIKYLNLICVQLICMGTTSPLVFEKFINEKSRGKITEISERYKLTRTSWSVPYIRIKGEQDIYYCRPYDLSEFSFFFKWIGRDSCYKCQYKGENREADITIGDFWGVSNYLDTINQAGMSIVSTHTEKGYYLMDKIGWNHLEDYDEKKYNPYILKCRPKNPQRVDIIRMILTGSKCIATVDKFATAKERIRLWMAVLLPNKVWNYIHGVK
jgi:coenzyme F420-reducing hydrogenase beta subunit